MNDDAMWRYIPPPGDNGNDQNDVGELDFDLLYENHRDDERENGQQPEPGIPEAAGLPDRDGRPDRRIRHHDSNSSGSDALIFEFDEDDPAMGFPVGRRPGRRREEAQRPPSPRPEEFDPPHLLYANLGRQQQLAEFLGEHLAAQETEARRQEVREQLNELEEYMRYLQHRLAAHGFPAVNAAGLGPPERPGAQPPAPPEPQPEREDVEPPDQLLRDLDRQQRFARFLREHLPVQETEDGRREVQNQLDAIEGRVANLHDRLAEGGFLVGDLQDVRVPRGRGNEQGVGGAQARPNDQARRQPNQRRDVAGRRRNRRQRQGRVGTRGISPATRRRIRGEIVQLQFAHDQVRVHGDREEARQIRDEMQYLEDILSGRFAQALGNQDGADERAEGRIIEEHLGPRLSDEDARLPQRGMRITEPIALFDNEGPRYMMLVTLDNPAPAAVAEAAAARATARRAFARYEAPWTTIVERAAAAGDLELVSEGARGAIWTIRGGREDVLGALLAAREPPFGLRTWELLGVGSGAAEGAMFMLHAAGDSDGSAAGSAGGSEPDG